MFQQERMDRIMQILRKYHYVTVDYLVEEIRYSPASIRRDIALLAKQGLVTRSYGGVSINDNNESPFRFRQHSMKIAKNHIAEQAAALVEDNSIVFIDGSTSAQYMGHFLVNKKGITVVTNNMTLASYLRENGINTYCTGGFVNEIPGILVGDITNDAFSRFHADIMFFSTVAFDKGYIYENDENYYSHHKIMIKNSDKRVFLCGSDKISKKHKLIVCNLESIDYFISDVDIDDEIKSAYENTEFICSEKSK